MNEFFTFFLDHYLQLFSWIFMMNLDYFVSPWKPLFWYVVAVVMFTQCQGQTVIDVTTRSDINGEFECGDLCH